MHQREITPGTAHRQDGESVCSAGICGGKVLRVHAVKNAVYTVCLHPLFLEVGALGFAHDDDGGKLSQGGGPPY